MCLTSRTRSSTGMSPSLVDKLLLYDRFDDAGAVDVATLKWKRE
jgi:hypothetical protein